MRAAEDIHVEWVEGEAVVLNTASGELHYLNRSAALVLALIQEHGYESAIDQVHQRFGDDETVRSDLHELIGDMREKGLLVDE